MDDAFDELLSTPPAEFVAVRNRIVAGLKEAGDAEAAKRIAKLRRPALVDWALNVTARDRPDLAASWAAAAATARDAGGTEMRAAITALRDATVQVVRAAGDRAPAGDVAQALTRIAADADAVDAFVAGTLGFDDASAAPRPARGQAVDTPAPEDGRAAARAAAVEAARTALDEAEAARDAAERALADAAAELDEARRRRESAERAHLAAQRKLTAAQRIVAEATTALADAEREP